MPPTTPSALMLEAKLALFSLLFAFGSFLGAFCAFGRVFGRSEPVFSCHGSILEGFRPRFGRVFGRFSGPKMHARSDLKKSVQQAKSIGPANTKSMSALLKQRVFSSKNRCKIACFLGVRF